jgi:hypothetical protein
MPLIDGEILRARIGREGRTPVSPSAGPLYMSPEQAAGEGEVDGRSDPRSLGADGSGGAAAAMISRCRA